MNPVFKMYSNVYSTAMMQATNSEDYAATAKDRTDGRHSSFWGRFGRR